MLCARGRLPERDAQRAGQYMVQVEYKTTENYMRLPRLATPLSGVKSVRANSLFFFFLTRREREERYKRARKSAAAPYTLDPPLTLL